MSNSGEKFRALNILTLVLSEKRILNETKSITPPPPPAPSPTPHCKLNCRSLTVYLSSRLTKFTDDFTFLNIMLIFQPGVPFDGMNPMSRPCGG